MDPVPEGVEAIASSSSQDEADAEDSPTKFRKRRRILRKSRVKNKQKGKRAKRTVDVTNIDGLSEAEADSEQELKAATIKDVAALILPSQVNSLVEA